MESSEEDGFEKSSESLSSCEERRDNEKRCDWDTGGAAVVGGFVEAQSTPGNSSSQTSQDASVVDAGGYCLVCLRDDHVTSKFLFVRNQAEFCRFCGEQARTRYWDLLGNDQK